MIGFEWSSEKNKILKKQRGICFEEIMEALRNGNQLDDISHPNKEKYSHQKILIVEIDNYAYTIPYVITEEGNKFLKTVMPDRRYTKKYLKH